MQPDLLFASKSQIWIIAQNDDTETPGLACPVLVCVGTRSDKDLTALFINVLLVFVRQRWKVGRNGPFWALETTLSSPGESAPAQKVTHHERTPSQLHILFLPISLPCSGVLASLAMKHDSHQ